MHILLLLSKAAPYKPLYTTHSTLEEPYAYLPIEAHAGNKERSNVLPSSSSFFANAYFENNTMYANITHITQLL